MRQQYLADHLDVHQYVQYTVAMEMYLIAMDALHADANQVRIILLAYIKCFVACLLHRLLF